MCVLFFICLFSVISSFKLFFVFILHIFLVLLFSHGFIYWWFECLNCFLPLLYFFEDYSTSHYFVLKSNASFSFPFKFFSLVLSSCFIRIFINNSRFSSLSLISLSSNLDRTTILFTVTYVVFLFYFPPMTLSGSKQNIIINQLGNLPITICCFKTEEL